MTMTMNHDADFVTWIVHCSMLAEDAIKSAISNYYTKNPQTKTTNLAGTEAKMPAVGEAVAAAAASA